MWTCTRSSVYNFWKVAQINCYLKISCSIRPSFLPCFDPLVLNIVSSTLKELTKEKMQNKNMSYMNGYLNASAVGGGVGAIAHDLWMNPCDVVKQRLQVKGSPYVNMSYASIVSNIYRNEGFRAFYLSFPTQMASNGTGFKLVTVV